MRTLRFLLLLFFLPLAACLAQDQYAPERALSSEELFLKEQNNRAFVKPGQRYLALDFSPILGSYHRFRYFVGDQIRFAARGGGRRQRQEIYTISDSSFSFAYIDLAANRMSPSEVLLRDIRKVKAYRRIPWATEGALLLPLAGLIFIGADFFNKGLDDRHFTTDAKALAVGGALATTGFICYRLSFPSIKLNGHNRMKVMKTY